MADFFCLAFDTNGLIEHAKTACFTIENFYNFLKRKMYNNGKCSALPWALTIPLCMAHCSLLLCS